MPGRPHAGSIRTVLSTPGVRPTFALALVGRLTYGLLPLCFLFTVRDATGSFATAATASGANALATLAMPLQARLVDAHGQRRVLPTYAAAFVATLLTAVALARWWASTVPSTTWLGVALLLGLTAPALGPATRAQWRQVAPEGPLRRAAYSLDSVGEESLYLVGPVLASAVLATGHPELGLLLAAACSAVGTSALARSPHAPRPDRRADRGVPTAPTAPRVRGRGLLLVRRFLGLLLVMSLLGASGAACFVGLGSSADRAHRLGALGPVEAATAVAAVLAGLGWARLRHEPPWGGALLALLACLLLAQSGAALAAPDLLAVALLLVVCGAATSPLLVVAFTASDELVPPEARTEASTWVTTALNAGAALGTALAAALVPRPAAPFVLAAGLTLAAVLVTAAARRT